MTHLRISEHTYNGNFSGVMLLSTFRMWDNLGSSPLIHSDTGYITDSKKIDYTFLLYVGTMCELTLNTVCVKAGDREG